MEVPWKVAVYPRR